MSILNALEFAISIIIGGVAALVVLTLAVAVTHALIKAVKEDA